MGSVSGQAEKDLEKIFRVVRQQGGSVVRSTGRAGKHWKVTAPDGAIQFTARTPSDWRGIRNLRAWLGRHGVNFNGRRRVQMAEAEAGTIEQQAAELGIELPENDEMLTTKQAAEILNITPSAVRSQPKEMLHGVRQGEGRTAPILYRRSEVEALARLRGPREKRRIKRVVPARMKDTPTPAPTPQPPITDNGSAIETLINSIKGDLDKLVLLIKTDRERTRDEVVLEMIDNLSERVRS